MTDLFAGNVDFMITSLLGHPSVPAKNLSDLVALARKAPGRMNYASTGSGTSGNLSMELFKSMFAASTASLMPRDSDIYGVAAPEALTILPSR